MIIIDNFVEDKELLADIVADEDFWKHGYRWWGGWWQTAPSDLRHRLIEYIWRYNCPNTLRGIETAGFEHWVGIHTPDNEPVTGIDGNLYSLRPHCDKDESYWENHPNGKNKGDHPDSFISPKIGTVYYIKAPEEGGYLKLWNTKVYNINKDTPYELIKPKDNRLVIFDASLIHAVTQVTKGTRKAIAINLWDKKPTTEMEE
jgi:hypothetical protein